MYKHIKVLVRPNQVKNYVELIIVEQTHRRSYFGKDSESFLAKSVPVRLYSVANPRYYGDYDHDGILQLYLRGHDTMNDNTIVDIPTKDWPLVRTAIEEYNEYFKE